MIYPGGFNPYRRAEALGIDLVHRDLGEQYGLWVPDLHTIFLTPGMRGIHEVCVLTHELAHAILGHREGTPKNERQANLFMAHTLVDPHRLSKIQAESQDPSVWANELGVTLQTLEIFMEHGTVERQWDVQHTVKDLSIRMESTGKPQSQLMASAR